MKKYVIDNMETSISTLSKHDPAHNNVTYIGHYIGALYITYIGRYISALFNLSFMFIHCHKR